LTTLATSEGKRAAAGHDAQKTGAQDPQKNPLVREVNQLEKNERLRKELKKASVLIEAKKMAEILDNPCAPQKTTRTNIALVNEVSLEIPHAADV